MTRPFIAGLLALALVACSGDAAENGEPSTVQQPSQSPSPEQGRPGLAFSGVYAVSATNTGTTGEPGFEAQWEAVPVCARGACDAELTIYRPGFEPYAVLAEATSGGAWRWQPIIQFSCPETGSPYEVVAGGFVVAPSARQRTLDGPVAKRLEGWVRVRLTANGCAPMRLSYAVTAEWLPEA